MAQARSRYCCERHFECISRRGFVHTAAVLGGLAGAGRLLAATKEPNRHKPLAPIGQPKGVSPGRVVWVHDPGVVAWRGQEDGYWWQGEKVSFDGVAKMLCEAICRLADANSLKEAWQKLFAYHNKQRGRGAAGYRPSETIAIKPNWVGMIYREWVVDPELYRFTAQRPNYMNVSPHLLLALVEQLVGELGVRPADIAICDTLAYVVHEYYDIIHGAYPDVRFEDHGGKFGRVKVKASEVPLYWSCRPEGVLQDFVPSCFAEADYLINVAAFKAHMGAGVTLCAKNHYGSLVRWPAQKGYYDMHPNCFSTAERIYRPLVDLIGHDQLGGKTVLCLIDGLFCGVHPRDRLPQRMHIAPFQGQWPCSLFASQDHVAIDSVAYDFLQAEGTKFARKGGVDDYLHEAALAADPPSGTFYDPNHAKPTRRLASLGVHEHWNNPVMKQYSGNLGTGPGRTERYVNNFVFSRDQALLARLAAAPLPGG